MAQYQHTLNIRCASLEEFERLKSKVDVALTDPNYRINSYTTNIDELTIVFTLEDLIVKE